MCIILSNEGHGACVAQTMPNRLRIRKQFLTELHAPADYRADKADGQKTEIDEQRGHIDRDERFMPKASSAG
jgi:hypothetical protein